MRTKTIYKSLAKIVFLFSLALTSSANAGLIFESAESPESGQTPNLGGLAVEDTFYVMHRFYLDATYTIDSIGGYFWADRGRNVFGAIIELSDKYDLPNSYDFTSSDLLGTTLINIGSQDGDYLGNISLTIDTGWYAVAFGTGVFGADNSGPVYGYMGMPDLEKDLSTDYPITSVLDANPRFVYQASTARFIVNGSQSVEVPEPNTVYIVFIGIALMSLSRKARTVK